MGSQKQTQTTNATTVTNPWARTIPTLDNLIGQVQGLTGSTGMTPTESASFEGLARNAMTPSPYRRGIENLASDLLGRGERTNMVRDAYADLQAGLTPYATANTNPYENEAFTRAVGFMSDDIMNRIKSQYAGAGYSPVTVGDFGKTVGEGISRGIAPTWLQAYNDMEARKLGAIEGLYNAGGQTAGLLTDLASRGIDVANVATAAKNKPYERLLELESAKRNIPIQNLAALENLIIPMAQLGGTSNTNSTTTAETKVPIGQQILGGALAGLGLLSGMPLGGLGGGSLFGNAGLLGSFSGLGGLFGGGGLSSSAYGNIPLRATGGLY